MKKKILLLAIIGLSASSCNYQVIDFDLQFKKVHIFENGKCYEISSWRDYEDGEQFQVDIKGYGKVLLSSYSAILVQDKCPICGD